MENKDSISQIGQGWTPDLQRQGELQPDSIKTHAIKIYEKAELPPRGSLPAMRIWKRWAKRSRDGGSWGKWSGTLRDSLSFP